jgi:hypothetical protein
MAVGTGPTRPLSQFVPNGLGVRLFRR